MKFTSLLFRTLVVASLGTSLLCSCSAIRHTSPTPKKVLVVTVTKGFRHSSIPTAEKVLAELAQKSGAFTVDYARVEPNDPQYRGANGKPDTNKVNEAIVQVLAEKMSPEALKKLDGVIFANTTGDLPLPDKDGFIKWIEDGHAFAAMHSGSDTFHHFPAYINMLGGEFETHHAQVPADLIAADKAHPANAGIGENWNLKQEEMYHIKSQDRSKVHMLWFMRHDPNETSLQVFFPVSWCKMAGKGRVFYTSLGHREDLWSDDPNMKGRVNTPEISKQYQAHILGGIKWALGLAEGSATPNPEVK